MGQFLAALDAVWKVVAVGLLLGAGLPALFSLGVRAHASGRLGWAIASYAVVGVSVFAGIAVIVAHGLGYKI